MAKAKNKFDIDFKNYCINHNLVKQVNRIRYEKYILDEVMFNLEDNEIDNNLFDVKYKNFIREYGHQAYLCCCQISNAFYHRKSRIRDRLYSMLSVGTVLFLTFSFRNDVLNSTDYKTRRTYVRRYLKEYSDYYIANIDFGENTVREHYHALILCDWVDMSKWKYGFMWARVVRDNPGSIGELSKYVDKLSSHALKQSTGRSKYIIYGRKIKELTQK